MKIRSSAGHARLFYRFLIKRDEIANLIIKKICLSETEKLIQNLNSKRKSQIKQKQLYTEIESELEESLERGYRLTREKEGHNRNWYYSNDDLKGLLK